MLGPLPFGVRRRRVRMDNIRLAGRIQQSQASVIDLSWVPAYCSMNRSEKRRPLLSSFSHSVTRVILMARSLGALTLRPGYQPARYTFNW